MCHFVGGNDQIRLHHLPGHPGRGPGSQASSGLQRAVSKRRASPLDGGTLREGPARLPLDRSRDGGHYAGGAKVSQRSFERRQRLTRRRRIRTLLQGLGAGRGVKLRRLGSAGVSSRPPIRPLASARARRSGRPTRRSSSSSRGDPDEPEPPLGGLTFELFHELTPGLPGHERLELFEALPAPEQEPAWRNLARQEELR